MFLSTVRHGSRATSWHTHADALPGACPQFPAVDQDGAPRGRFEPGYDAQERRLARTVEPDDGDESPGRNVQVDAVEDPQVPFPALSGKIFAEISNREFGTPRSIATSADGRTGGSGTLSMAHPSSPMAAMPAMTTSVRCRSRGTHDHIPQPVSFSNPGEFGSHQGHPPDAHAHTHPRADRRHGRGQENLDPDGQPVGTQD